MSAIFDVECIVDDLSPLAIGVLAELGPHDDFGYLAFGDLEKRCGATRAEIKAALGELLKHDLAVFALGLMTEAGDVAGSGYAASDDGYRLRNIVQAWADSMDVVRWRRESRRKAAEAEASADG